jgi:hypothetical protein
MQNTVELGQIPLEKNCNGPIVQYSKCLNLELGSTLFYDIGNQFAAGAALGSNLNNLKPFPEVGFTLTYKPFTTAELNNILKTPRFPNFLLFLFPFLCVKIYKSHISYA